MLFRLYLAQLSVGNRPGADRLDCLSEWLRRWALARTLR
jgi:hypothetical protein